MIGTTMDVSTNTTGIREDEIDVQTYIFPGRPWQTSKTMKDSEGGQRDDPASGELKNPDNSLWHSHDTAWFFKHCK